MSMRMHDYADEVPTRSIDKLRIVKTVDETGVAAWQLDGVSINVGDPDGPIVVGWSEDVYEFQTWQEAVNAIPDFVYHNNLDQRWKAR